MSAPPAGLEQLWAKKKYKKILQRKTEMINYMMDDEAAEQGGGKGVVYDRNYLIKKLPIPTH